MSATPREPAARAERRYLIATAVNIFGTGVQGIAVPWLLLELTGTAAAVGVLLILRALPAILLSSWAGALCDAGSRRRIAIASSAAQGAATLAAEGLMRHNGKAQLALRGGLIIPVSRAMQATLRKQGWG